MSTPREATTTPVDLAVLSPYTFEVRTPQTTATIVVWAAKTSVYLPAAVPDDPDTVQLPTVTRTHGEKTVSRYAETVTDEQEQTAAAALAAFDRHDDAAQLKEDARRHWVEVRFAKVDAFEQRLDRRIAELAALRATIDDLRGQADPSIDQPVPVVERLYTMPGYHTV